MYWKIPSFYHSNTTVKVTCNEILYSFQSRQWCLIICRYNSRMQRRDYLINLFNCLNKEQYIWCCHLGTPYCSSWWYCNGMLWCELYRSAPSFVWGSTVTLILVASVPPLYTYIDATLLIRSPLRNIWILVRFSGMLTYRCSYLCT